ncbi:uncharacterized protein F5891DRAFT_983664 [Suillus fuscotomentosus]|uniref:Uncharacterized protein n=1 Tax=Suillus fuscotomentosus TaxID=1912939 RepID=A0AAD4HGZ2_9AGAM|nr:uncharacterized protein F5891DRAFT_983664 [Suillus fuscotomentosus]KAG1896127.1 hypothetical protein F5891DRAFT_983664 [Suillus fuscotomentosus]
MSAPVNSCELRNAKKKAIENAERQCSLETNSEDEEEDGGHLESSGSEADLEPIKPKPQGLYRPNKLCRTYAMQDVSVLQDVFELVDTDELDSDGDQVDRSVMANDGDMDEESEHDKPETTAMVLADETPLLVTDNMKPKRVVQTHGKSQSAQDQKHSMELRQSLLSFEWRRGTSNYLTRTTRLKLVDKNQISLNSLLTVAQNLDVPAIKQCLQTDAQYAAHLSSLVEPHILLLCRDLKITACANIDGYFRLGQNLVKARKLMEQHAYVYALKFDEQVSSSYSLLHITTTPSLHSNQHPSSTDQ